MNMKKTLAGVLASVVAVSAMATVAVSAATTEQKEGTKLINLSKKGWRAVWELEATTTNKDGGLQIVTGKDVKLGVGSDIGDLKITISGTTGASNGTAVATKTTKVTVKYNKTAGDYVLTIVKSGASSKGDLNLGEFSSITGVTVAAELKGAEKVKEKDAKDEGETASGKFQVKNLVKNVTFELYAPEGKYEKIDDEGIEIDLNKSGVSLNKVSHKGTTEGTLGYTIVNAIGDKKGAKIVMTFAPPDDDMGEVDSDLDSPELDYEEVEGTIKDLSLSPAITPVSINTINGEHYAVYSPVWSGKIQGNADIIDKTKATFDWDKIVNKSGLKINSLGVINDIVLGHKDSKKVKLEKVEVTWPAGSFNDLSAGEGQTESEEAIVTTTGDAAEVTTTVATEATEGTSNPTTGNAPIALAIIPVAIAAAAIVAKKRG